MPWGVFFSPNVEIPFAPSGASLHISTLNNVVNVIPRYIELSYQNIPVHSFSLSIHRTSDFPALTCKGLLTQLAKPNESIDIIQEP